MNVWSSINWEIVSLRPTTLLEVVIYGDKKLDDKSNHWILNAAIKNTQRFVQALLWISEGNPIYQLAVTVFVYFSWQP